jgi:predicted alpha/beta-hydrolase family hydrolase
MTANDAQPVKIDVDAAGAVSGLLNAPKDARACYVLAHGAGAGMHHAFMEAVAAGLFDRGIATLRYQFPYMERGSRRPDAPAVAQRTVRAAVDEASRLLPGVPLLAGGKSFGGRMTSQAQAESPLAGVRGLVFLGFPLHAPKKPATKRADHLFDVQIPMLFLQGTRDDLADLELLEPITREFGERATLRIIDDGDHSFHVRVKSGRRDPEAMEEVLDAIGEWVEGVAG